MAFGWGGAAKGASDALQELLVERRTKFLQDQALQQQEAARQAAAEQLKVTNARYDRDFAYGQSRDAVGDARYATEEARRTRAEQAATSERTNEQGKRTLLGDFLTRRQPGSKLSDTERGTLEAMAVTDNIALPPSLMAKPQQFQVTTRGDKGQPVKKLVDEEAMAAGVDEYQEPKTGPADNWQPIPASGVMVNTRTGETRPLPSGTASGSGTIAGSEYGDERRTRVRDTIKEILGERQPDGTRTGGMLSGATTGAIGTISKNIPGTDARYLRGKLNTLKSGIAFGELTEMREASKTGGALGQVAVRELELLESSLGAIDQGLRDEHLAAELEKIEGSLDRWERAKQQGAGGGAGRGSAGGPGPGGAAAGGVVRWGRDAQGRPVRLP